MIKDREEFDLSILAPNGLRRGRTTGSCATGAVKAALYLMLRNEHREHVEVTLPDNARYIVVPIQNVQRLDEQTIRAEVLKDGGDDPDNTHGATIFAEVRRNDVGEIRFFAGRGVGTATQPGLRVPVGEPAINPVPRQMMRQAVAEMLAEGPHEEQNAGSKLDVTALNPSAADSLPFKGRAGVGMGLTSQPNPIPLPTSPLKGEEANMGFDLTIGCENGEEIAKKTFNPKLGVIGGISILGTSGIVEPMSLAAWIASIEVYVRVAIGGNADAAAYLPGKIGRPFARKVLGLPEKRIVQIANFLGDALDFTQQALVEEKRRLEVLWLIGHPGKLAKVLDDIWDTHSSKSHMAMGIVARVAAECGCGTGLVEEIEKANTVEAAMERLKDEPISKVLWTEIEQRIARQVHPRVPSVNRVEVRLFGLHGNALGAAA